MVVGVVRRVPLQEQPTKKRSIVDAMMVLMTMLMMPPLVQLHWRLVADPAAERANVGVDSMKWQQNLWNKSRRQMMRSRWRSSSTSSSRQSHPAAEEEETLHLGEARMQQDRKHSFRVS
jgi:hypothetical protein